MMVTVVVLMMLMLIGCRTTKYVPVETVRVEKKEVHDTLRLTDTLEKQKNVIVRKATAEDSAKLASLGLKLSKTQDAYLVLQSELIKERKAKEHIVERKDTVHDSVPVPYPVVEKVEKELSWWDKIRIWAGNLLIGGVVIIGGVFIMKRYTRL